MNTKITSNLAAENLARRHQLAVMKRTNKRPKIRMADRLFWVLLSRFWIPWRKSLVIVKPDTVVRLHRKGFKLFWKFKSKDSGRPKVERKIRYLVRKMAVSNPSWGAPWIHGEVVHSYVSSNPTAEWTAQQVVIAFPWDTAPKYLMRYRDAIYGVFFRNQVKNMGIREVISAVLRKK